jgi:hypothetical protein
MYFPNIYLSISPCLLQVVVKSLQSLVVIDYPHSSPYKCCESNFLSNSPQYPKRHCIFWLFSCLPASPDDSIEQGYILFGKSCLKHRYKIPSPRPDFQISIRHWNRASVDWYRGRSKYSEGSLSQCYFIRHKCHIDWANTETQPLLLRPPTNPPEPWHGPRTQVQKINICTPTSIPISKERRFVISVKASRPVLFMEIIHVCSSNYKKHCCLWSKCKPFWCPNQ